MHASTPIRVLIVEDCRDDVALLVHELKRFGFDPVYEQVATGEALRDVLPRVPWDIVISDFEMPGYGGLQALGEVRAFSSDLPFILLSGKVDQGTAVDAMRHGAHDFVMKGDTARLMPAIQRELEDVRIRREHAAEARRASDLQRRLEAEKMVVKRMQELDALKDRFVETVTHELRTPMAPLKSAVDLFLDGVLGAVTDKQGEVLRMMKRNIDRLSHMAGDILLLSRVASGRYSLAPACLNLAERLAPVVALLEHKAQERKVVLELDLPVDAGVFTDADALDLIVTNLVNNAIVHTREGTRVAIGAAVLSDGRVAVRVSDNGPGIPAEALPRLFDRFYQVARRSGPGYRGTGLGLAICKMLVEKMGGDIEVASEVGKGTVFTFTVPADAVRGGRSADAVAAAR